MSTRSRIEVWWYRDQLHCAKYDQSELHLFLSCMQIAALDASLFGYNIFRDEYDHTFVGWPLDMAEAVVKELARTRSVQAEQARLERERRQPPCAGAPVLLRLATALSITPASAKATYGDLTVGVLEEMVELLEHPSIRVVEIECT